MLKKDYLLIDVAKRLDYLLKPDQTLDYPVLVSLVLGLFDALNKEYEALVKMANSKLDLTQRNDSIMHIERKLLLLML